MKVLTVLLAFFITLTPASLHGIYGVGDTVPDFTLYDPDGVAYSLYDYAGQVVVLSFFRYS